MIVRYTANWSVPYDCKLRSQKFTVQATGLSLSTYVGRIEVFSGGLAVVVELAELVNVEAVIAVAADVVQHALHQEWLESCHKHFFIFVTYKWAKRSSLLGPLLTNFRRKWGVVESYSQHFFFFEITNGPNRLECLSLAGLSSLV